MDRSVAELWAELKSDIISPQRRGFAFEKLIEQILDSENLEPKASYKPKGEQIDGSFFWNGQTFLLEAKWTKDPVPASAIYSFKGKLDGKFHTSSGVFLSVGGYSNDVEDALKFGKSLNILLFLPEDIELIFCQNVNFLEVLKFKIRQAGDTGSLAVPYKLNKKVKGIHDSVTINKGVVDEVDLLVITEYKGNEEIVQNYLEPIVDSFEYSYKILSIDGKEELRLIPSIISLYEETSALKGVLVFTDNYFTGEESISPLMELIKDQVENSAISINLRVIEFNKKVKSLVEKYKNADWNDIYQLREYRKAIDFLIKIEEEYEYNPISDSVNTALEGVIENLSWDLKNKRVTIPSDLHPGHGKEFTDLRSLVSEINDEVVSQAISNFPLMYLNEYGTFDYTDDVIDYLTYNKETELKDFGWYDEL